MSKKLIAGNWKMNGGLAANEALIQAMLAGIGQPAADVALCAPAPYLAQLQTLLQGSAIAWGSQDVSAHEQGAYTGEVSVAMLKDFGCRYAIVGHSERRQYHGETDELVAAKAQRALAGGVTPIVCVGEKLDVRKAGEHVAHVTEQLVGSLAGLTEEQLLAVVIAYEPVWAIGTGEVASPEDAQEVCQVIREWIAENYSQAVADQVRVLYGGSVKSSNIAGIMAKADVDGALIGGASLDADEYATIVRYRLHPQVDA